MAQTMEYEPSESFDFVKWGPAFQRAVPRDLLPLPLCDVVGKVSVPSRRACQRLGEKNAIALRTNEIIAAINAMWGGGSFQGVGPPPLKLLQCPRLYRLVSIDKPPADAPAPEAALSALLGSKSWISYSDFDDTTFAPHLRDFVSLPSAAGRCSLSSACQTWSVFVQE